MTITVARMWAGTSRKSGRRYLRGRDKFGSTWWLMQKRLPGGGMAWELKVDLGGSIAEPDGLIIESTATDIRRILSGSGNGPILIEGDVER